MFRYIAIFFGFALFFNLSAQDYEVTVTSVSVWVKATDKSGKPVPGLTQSDFELYEDGKKVDTTCFEEVTLPAQESPAPAGGASQSQELSAGSRKQIVFVMDLANTSQNEFLHLKKKAAEFLEQLSANWDISLVTLIPGMIQVDLERSQDPLIIQAALDKMKANSMRDIDTLNQRKELSTALKLGEKLPRKDPRIVSEICNLARGFAIKEKNVSMLWMRSLKDFDSYIKKQSPDTHKVVLFFSGGISSNPGRQYFDLVRNSNLMKEYTRDEFDVLREFPECQDEGGNDLQKEFKRLIGQLNRYNITFYTVSSRGPINDLLETVREGDRKYHIDDLDFLKEYQDFMALTADETGGIYFGNSLNFKRGFDAILSDLNHQYLLCYTPPQHAKAGAHTIKVKSKRDGLKLRHRSGYHD